MTTQQFLEIAATLVCALFAGAALYINVVEHPARMSCSTHIAVTEWAPSYRRATWLPNALRATACRGWRAANSGAALMLSTLAPRMT